MIFKSTLSIQPEEEHWEFQINLAGRPIVEFQASRSSQDYVESDLLTWGFQLYPVGILKFSIFRDFLIRVAQ